MCRRMLADLKKYFGYSVVSAAAQLRAEVASSYLNWLWWILNPVCFMLIYTFMFGSVFNSREPYFPIFIFIGLSMWDFFNRMMTQSVKLVKNNKPIVTKVYLPKYILVLTRLWINGFKMMISFGVVALMILFVRVPVTWNAVYFFPVLLALAILTFGLSVLVMHYGVFVEDLSNVVSIGLRLVFYLTGIFYNVSARIPKPYGKLLLRWNPMAFLLDSMRRSILYGQTPGRGWLLIWLIVGCALSFAGIFKVYRNENEYVKVI